MQKKIISAAGLVFLFVTAYAQTVTLIPSLSAWKYLSNGSNQGTAWRSPSFNDAGWSAGNAQLGYGDGDEATVVGYGPNAGSKYITTYFRKSFTAGAPAGYSSLKVYIKRDDGAVIYLNGTQVAKTNMPSGTISYTTRASTTISGSGESTFYSYTVNKSLLVAGTNVIAVEVHQYNGLSPDLSFDLKLEAVSAPSSCAIPAGLSASSITTNAATLNWTAVTGALGYNIQYRPSGGSAWTTASAATNTLAVSSLSVSTAYEWQVQTVCAAGNSAYSGSAAFSTLTAGVDSLIASSSSWRYLDNGSNQGTAWYQGGFNDASWASGYPELGYGDGGETTVTSYGANASVKYITTYFRRTFNVTNPQAYYSLALGVVRDDGIVVYINGTEVYRNNMPAGTISYTTLAPVAIGGADESAWTTAAIPVSSLIQGINVIAVEVHQQAVTSTDVSFNLRLYASTTPPLPAVIRGPYLQKLTQQSVTVRWRTDMACNSKVQAGTITSYGVTVTDAASTTEHVVTVSGLTPATKYYYSIGTTSAALQGDTNNTFTTAPPDGTILPVRIWATGDFGNGSTAQDNVRNAYMNYPGAQSTNLWIWLGDNAYSTGTDAEFQVNVFNHYPMQFKKFPLYPAPGNHDYGNAGYQVSSVMGTSFPYFNIFSVPQAGEAGGVASNTPKYYAYNYGNIHFISLDSYGALNTTGSAMYNWLSSDLAANTQHWTIVYWHHPPYTKGTHNSDTDSELINMRTNIVPLLENYHVDMVLCGHSHINERSYLIKGHYGIANTFSPSMKISSSGNSFVKSAPFDGTVYVTCGTSGQTPGAVQTTYPMPCMFYNDNTNNCSLVIDVNGDNLSCKYLTAAGTIADQFTIVKSGLRAEAPHTNLAAGVYYNAEENTINLNYQLVKDSKIQEVVLYNIMGEKVHTFKDMQAFRQTGFYNQELSLDGVSLPGGIYLFSMTINGERQIKKLIISK